MLVTLNKQFSLTLLCGWYWYSVLIYYNVHAFQLIPFFILICIYMVSTTSYLYLRPEFNVNRTIITIT